MSSEYSVHLSLFPVASFHGHLSVWAEVAQTQHRGSGLAEMSSMFLSGSPTICCKP